MFGHGLGQLFYPWSDESYPISGQLLLLIIKAELTFQVPDTSRTPEIALSDYANCLVRGKMLLEGKGLQLAETGGVYKSYPPPQFHGRYFTSISQVFQILTNRPRYNPAPLNGMQVH